MALNASIRFTQDGVTKPAGEAMVVQPGLPVTVEVADVTDIVSWRIQLAHVEPGSSLGTPAPGAPVLFGEDALGASAPVVSFTPDVPGSYRIVATIWDEANFSGASDRDIRNAIVPLEDGLLIPPQQFSPPQILDGSKPDELNVDGQPYGFAGTTSQPFMSELFRRLSRLDKGLDGAFKVFRTNLANDAFEWAKLTWESLAESANVRWTQLLGVGTEVLDPSGWPLPGSQNDANVTMSYDVATRTFTLTHVGDYNVWVAGTRVTITGDLSVVWPNTAGAHFFYLDAAGALQTTMSFDVWLDVFRGGAPVAYLIWHSSGVVTQLGEERHGMIDGEAHVNLHRTRGTQWIRGGGGDLYGFTFGDGSLDAHAQFSVTQVLIADEDIVELIAPNGLNTFDPLTARTWAKVGTEWVVKDYDAFPGVMQSGANYTGGTYTGANGRIAWNEITAGVGALTETTNNDYVLAHVFATTEASGNSADGGSTNWGIEVILGQAEYLNPADLEEGALLEVRDLVLAGLPFQEFAFLGTVAFQSNSAYTNSVTARTVQVEDILGNTVDYIDLRDSGIGSGGGGGGGGVTDHGALTGLSDDDHTQYLLADGSRVAAFLSAASHVVVDAANAAVSGAIRLKSGDYIRGRYLGSDHNMLGSNGGNLDVGDGAGINTIYLQALNDLRLLLDSSSAMTVTPSLFSLTYPGGQYVQAGAGFIGIAISRASTGNVRLPTLGSIYGLDASLSDLRIIGIESGDYVGVGQPSVVVFETETTKAKLYRPLEIERYALAGIAAPTGTEGQLVYDTDGNLYWRTASKLVQLA